MRLLATRVGSKTRTRGPQTGQFEWFILSGIFWVLGCLIARAASYLSFRSIQGSVTSLSVPSYHRMGNILMKSARDISLALERLFVPELRLPERPGVPDTDSGLEIAVVFTSIQATLGALKRAGLLAARLNAHINLVVPQIVPYPLPLASPPVPLDFNERRFRLIANESPVETRVRVYLCRDRDVALSTVLKPHSLIVIGGRRRWWLIPEQRLAGKLRRAGHEVILTFH